MQTTKVKSPTVPAVSLESVKQFGRVTTSKQDEAIELAIAAATTACENYMKHPIGLSEFKTRYIAPRYDTLYGLRSRVYDPEDIAKVITLPKRPVVAVLSVSVRTIANPSALTVLPPTDYVVSGGKVYFTEEANLLNCQYETVEVHYSAGHKAVDDETNCPLAVKQAIAKTAMHIFDGAGAGDIAAVPKDAKTLLRSYLEGV